MLSPNAGSRLVWFEFPSPGEPEIVVYDTGSGREVVRDTVALAPGHTAVPAELSERFVYWFKDPDSETICPRTRSSSATTRRRVSSHGSPSRTCSQIWTVTPRCARSG